MGIRDLEMYPGKPNGMVLNEQGVEIQSRLDEGTSCQAKFGGLHLQYLGS